jgi:hypothetical protein
MIGIMINFTQNESMKSNSAGKAMPVINNTNPISINHSAVFINLARLNNVFVNINIEAVKNI